MWPEVLLPLLIIGAMWFSIHRSLGKIMTAQSDLQTSVANLIAAAATLIANETAVISALQNNDPATEAAVANINTVVANLTAAAAALPTAPTPGSTVTPVAATQALAPANPAPSAS